MDDASTKLTESQQRTLHDIPQTLGVGAPDAIVIEELTALRLVEKKLGALGLTAKGAHVKAMLGSRPLFD